jgi:hypothetical protein
MGTNDDIPWNQTIKKEARGINDEDFGEVQDIQGNYVLVQRGILNKKKFYIPKEQAESYDGDVLSFRFSEQELTRYQGEPFMKDAESDTLESDMNKLKEELNLQEKKK